MGFGITARPLLFPGCPGILDESCWRTARFWSFMSEPVVSDEDFAAGPLYAAQTFRTRRARTSRARSQPWSEGGPSREGKRIRAVQHGREIAARPTPTIKSY